MGKCVAVLHYAWLVTVAIFALCTGPQSAAAQSRSDASLIDEVHDYTYDRLWRAAMKFDHLFGSEEHEAVYRKLYGSIAPALLWDEFRGFQPKIRFQLNAPLPFLDERLHAVVGRFNPDEFVTERSQSSGSIARQFGSIRDDDTIFGLAYRSARVDAGEFGLGTGVRVATPLDPYLKGDYTIRRGTPRSWLLTYKQTLFWQQSEHIGTTSRVDFDHFLSRTALLTLTASGTLSQKSAGLRGFAEATVLRSLGPRRSIAANLSIDWQSRAPVALHEFGIAGAYRQSVYRDWLIFELRSSVTWPKETIGAARTRSYGVGIGVEMLIGTTQFLARPVSF